MQKRKITGKTSHVKKWEMRQGGKPADESGAFLPVLAFSLFPFPASHLHLQQHLWNRSVSLTFFSSPLLLLFSLQFLKLIVLSATQLAVWKDLFWVSSQCKCSLNEILSMHSLSFQRHRAEAHPKLIALRMTSLCSLLLQVLSLYALANHD